MDLFSKLRYLLPARRRAVEEDMREELASLASVAEADGRRGDLGNLTRVAEEGRAAWTWAWLEQLTADVRYACRMLRRNPSLTVIAISSLALGIGANTAIFSLMNAILLSPLPVKDPAGLIVLTSYAKDGRIGDFGYPDYLEIRRETAAFSVLAASPLSQRVAGIGGEPETVQCKIVSSNYFSVLQVQTELGRPFREGEDEQPLAVIGHRWWRRSFAGSPDVLGRQVDLDGKAFTIVGVAPPEFLSETVGESVDAWTTMAFMPPARRNAPGYTWLNLLGRLNPGVSPPQAAARLAALTPRLPNRFIERIEVQPGSAGSSALRDTFSAPLQVLMGVVALELLMACANLAGLLLAQAAGRRREIATRLAIGASRARLFRQLITESMVLSLLGGLFGLGLSVWGQQALLSLVSGAGRSVSVDLRPGLRVFLFNSALSLLTGVLFGAAPALQAVRKNVGESLKIGSGGTPARPGRLGLRGGLVAAQVALSMVLLTAGGLFVHTLRNLKNQDLGLRAANVLSLRIAPQAQYQPAWPALMTELLRRAEAVPGVQSACMSFDGALGNAGGIRGFRIEGSSTSGGEEPRAGASWVSPKYFATLGIPLLAGREFSQADNAGSMWAVMVNRSMALRYAGTDRAVGRSLVFNGKTYQIVGVVQDSKRGDLRSSVQPFVYFAALQDGSALHTLEVRTAVPPASVAADMRRVLREVDPRMTILTAATLEQIIGQKLARESLVADLAGFFAGLTLMLVILGVYGAVAYAVGRRTKEIGIRVALGARRAHIAEVVVGRLVLAISAGLVVGTAAALASARLFAFLLFGVTAADVPTIGAALLLLCLAAFIAGYVPVRRAWQLDPTAALRLE